MNKRKIFYIMAMTVILTSATFSGETNVSSKEPVAKTRIDVRLETPKLVKERQIEEAAAKLEEVREQEETERLRLEREEEVKRIQEEMARIPHFNPYDLSETSNLTREKAYAMLEGSALQAASDAYVYAEEVYGVNAIFLMALTSLESGHGRSELAMYRNNIGGVKSCDGDWKYFSDWAECIYYISNFLSDSYLKEDGACFNGYSVWGVNVKYCQDDSDWAGMIIDMANAFIEGL